MQNNNYQNIMEINYQNEMANITNDLCQSFRINNIDAQIFILNITTKYKKELDFYRLLIPIDDNLLSNDLIYVRGFLLFLICIKMIMHK